MIALQLKKNSPTAVAAAARAVPAPIAAQKPKPSCGAKASGTKKGSPHTTNTSVSRANRETATMSWSRNHDISMASMLTSGSDRMNPPSRGDRRPNSVAATMTTAAYQHILTAGLNIYVLELVVLYLGGSLALLLNGPGRFSFDAAMGPELIAGIGASGPCPESAMASSSGTLIPAPIPVEAFNGAR